MGGGLLGQFIAPDLAQAAELGAACVTVAMKNQWQVSNPHTMRKSGRAKMIANPAMGQQTSTQAILPNKA